MGSSWVEKTGNWKDWKKGKTTVEWKELRMALMLAVSTVEKLVEKMVEQRVGS
jgi:hypothetical protein